jgi:hypothetical protein
MQTVRAGGPTRCHLAEIHDGPVVLGCHLMILSDAGGKN